MFIPDPAPQLGRTETRDRHDEPSILDLAPETVGHGPIENRGAVHGHAVSRAPELPHEPSHGRGIRGKVHVHVLNIVSPQKLQ